MGKRKDSKGRVLKSGESQRENGSYQFRYNDIHGKRRYVYAKSLDELRQKEKNIQRDIADGIDTTGAEITAIDLLKKYANTKQFLSQNTQEQYYYAVCTLSKEPFMHIQFKNGRVFPVKFCEVGKTVFTTREAAEAALKEQEG